MAYKTFLAGNCRQVTIAQANIVQALVTESTRVRRIIVAKDSTAAGTVLMGYGTAAPLFTSLDLDAGPNGTLDLSLAYVKSTTANDKVNVQVLYEAP